MHITRLSDIPTEGVSHDPAIGKRVMVRAGVVPGLTNLSQARLRPGDRVQGHSHRDMWEIFLVEEGQGSIDVDGRVVALSAGTCVVVEPGERHELANTGRDDLVVTYLGVAPQAAG